ncbi:MAG: aldehyde:ferredoxin oxidoreductase [Candidatus Methanoliparum thermophilum]|uniref:Aldehyde:ferredoxin oxidoreductase n=1 Tax=Methanoliparum thermophilum TaxID=2491083 RepID=A0A520KS03_METT2|nr:MAG: aldehyde:ferredoxin oxidoreductase [Candidatus Methanoliparum thermophilum]
MNGWMNRILRIDLSKDKFLVEKIPKKVYHEFIGGKGLGAYFFYKEIKNKIDPLGPENKLIFTVGPAIATPYPTSGRYYLFFKSPLTGICGNSSSGGTAAERIKRCGYDAIIIEGISPRKTYLIITENGVEFKPADNIWGKDTFETEKIIKDDFGREESSVLTIGPAGENLVKYAMIVNDKWRCAGRCGPGAVMGSKKLKAILFNGYKDVEVNDPDRFYELTKKHISHKVLDNKMLMDTYRAYGTPIIYPNLAEEGAIPTRYFHKGYFDGWEKIGPNAIEDRLEIKNQSCGSCPIACGRLSEVKDGKYKGLRLEGPEHELLYSFGSTFDIDDLNFIAFCNDYADRMGIDSISTAHSIALAIDAYRMGKFDPGFELNYGDPECVIRLMRMISTREGVGNILAEDLSTIEKKFGMEGHAIKVKNLGVGGYDPRVMKGVALSYMVNDRGGCYQKASMYMVELFELGDCLSYDDEKVYSLIEREDLFTILDSFPTCKFYQDSMDIKDCVEVLNALTGEEYDEEELLTISNRIQSLLRLWNVREGITREDDHLSKRCYEEPVPDGPAEGAVSDRKEEDRWLDIYYDKRGWDKDGKPDEKSLEEFMRDMR